MSDQHADGSGRGTPAAPLVETTTTADSTTLLGPDGVRRDVPAGSIEEAREHLHDQVRRMAAEAGRPVTWSRYDLDGHQLLTVHPDGRVEADQATAPGPAPRRGREEADAGDVATGPAGRSPSWTTPGESSRPEAAPRRASFLAEPAPTPTARTGWRGRLSRLGIRVQPSAEELRYDEDVAVVSRHWRGPKTIVVANGKGGSSKTPVVIGLSAVFARFGGGGVCAWSNHQMRGTLGWHTVQDAHAATTQDLLAAAPSLLDAAGQIGDLARFVHHQPADRYDVLQADPTKTSDKQRFDHHAVDTIHAVLSRFYRVIVMDSDNDESTVHWRRMMDHADQLVVATTTDDVRAETGRLMLEDLRGRGLHAAQLAENAVVVVSQAHQDEPPAAGVAAKFTEYGLPVATIPYDQGMKRLKISYDGLSPATRRAYLSAAALVARSLHD